MPLPKYFNQRLYTTALTHRSALNEHLSTASESNERLEFLGDAVLELATTKYLFKECPDDPEGNLTSYRSALVKTSSLASLATELGVGELIYISKGEEAGGGRQNESLLADTMEALIGALYLDQDFEAVMAFLSEHLFIRFAEIKDKKLYRNNKNMLQEVVQGRGHGTPEYEVIDEQGPDHNKFFTVVVLVDGKRLGTGTGRSKQAAQQDAARVALEKLSQE